MSVEAVLILIFLTLWLMLCFKDMSGKELKKIREQLEKIAKSKEE